MTSLSWPAQLGRYSSFAARTRGGGARLLFWRRPAVADRVEVVVSGDRVLLDDVQAQRLAVLPPDVHQKTVVRNAKHPTGLRRRHSLVPHIL